MLIVPKLTVVGQHGDDADHLQRLPDTHLIHQQNWLALESHLQHLEDANELMPTRLEGHEIGLVGKPRGVGLVPPIVDVLAVVVGVEVGQFWLCQAEEPLQLLRGAGSELLDAACPVVVWQLIEGDVRKLDLAAHHVLLDDVLNSRGDESGVRFSRELPQRVAQHLWHLWL